MADFWMNYHLGIEGAIGQLLCFALIRFLGNKFT